MDLENFCICRSDLENLGELQLVIRALLAEGIRELSKAGCHGDVGRGRLARTYASREGDMSWCIMEYDYGIG